MALSPNADFDALVAEGNSVPTEGWDFSWFEGRATEERPPWGYRGLLGARLGGVTSALDIQTGGGEEFGAALAAASAVPPLVRATESWVPNLAVARTALVRFDAGVLEAPDAGPLPFGDATFELVSSRHPTVVIWDEIARVLAPGGTYFSQQVGAATNYEVSAAMLGPFESDDTRSPDRAVAAARAAGLEALDVQMARLRVEFFDIAAFVHFLRKVVWTVPDFTVDRYREQLREVHETVQRDGLFLAHSTRFLIEARKP